MFVYDSAFVARLDDTVCLSDGRLPAPLTYILRPHTSTMAGLTSFISPLLGWMITVFPLYEQQQAVTHPDREMDIELFLQCAEGGTER